MCFLPCFLHKQKTSRPPGRDRASSAACGTLLKKGKVQHRCTSPAIVWGHPRVQISPEHERLSGGAGFFKGRRPLNALLVPFRASEKGPAARGRIPRIPVPLAAHLSKKVRCCTAAHPPPLSGGEWFFKGRRPLNALLVPFRASEKGPAARGRTPRIPCRRKAAFFLKR